MTNLFHYSKCIVPSVYSVDQNGDGPGVYKPRGLWLSVEDTEVPDNERYSWADWCKSEDFNIGSIRHAVYLTEDANILRLRDPFDIDEFTTEFSSSDRQWSYSRSTRRKFGGTMSRPNIKASSSRPTNGLGA